MKPLFCALFALVLFLTGCSAQAAPKPQVSPYEFTGRETALLEALGLSRDVALVDFKAPQGATALEVTLYRLDGGAWLPSGGGMLYTGMFGGEDLSGTFALRQLDGYSMELTVRSKGIASYTTGKLFLTGEATGSSKAVLAQPQDLVLGAEVPVFLAMYTQSNSLSSHELEDYFAPQRFADEDFLLVQAVTLKFT